MSKKKVWLLVMIVIHLVFSGVCLWLGFYDLGSYGNSVRTILQFVLPTLFAFLAGMYVSDFTTVERRAKNVK